MSETQGFCIWVLQVVVLLGLLVFFLWLTLRPVNPTYTVVEFSFPASPGVEGANATANAPANATEALLGLEISNSNKEGGVHYDDIAVAIYLDDHNVGGATIPSFYQRHGHTTGWRGGVGAARGGRPWGTVLRALANGTAELKVGLLTAVRHRVWGWRSKAHRMDMQAALPVGSDGRITGKSRVRLHRAKRRWRLRR